MIDSKNDHSLMIDNQPINLYNNIEYMNNCSYVGGEQ